MKNMFLVVLLMLFCVTAQAQSVDSFDGECEVSVCTDACLGSVGVEQMKDAVDIAYICVGEQFGSLWNMQKLIQFPKLMQSYEPSANIKLEESRDWLRQVPVRVALATNKNTEFEFTSFNDGLAYCTPQVE